MLASDQSAIPVVNKTMNKLIYSLQMAMLNYVRLVDKKHPAIYNVQQIQSNKKLTTTRKFDLLTIHNILKSYQLHPNANYIVLCQEIYHYLQTIHTGFWIFGIKHEKFHVETGHSKLKQLLEINIHQFEPGLLLHCEMSYLLSIQKRTNKQQLRIKELRGYLQSYFVPRDYACQLQQEALFLRKHIAQLKINEKTNPDISRSLLQENNQLRLDKLHLQEQLEEQNEQIKSLTMLKQIPTQQPRSAPLYSK